MDKDKAQRLSAIVIESGATLRAALKLMDATGARLLVVTREKKFAGLLSIGDIQRAILADKALDSPIGESMRSDFNVAKIGDDIKKIKKDMLRLKMECMPILEADGSLVDIVFWDEIIDLGEQKRTDIDTQVVIMAGGKGARLQPLTNIIPKPLIPIGNKTILECIMQRFALHGVNEFLLSVNYKHEMIRAYLEQLGMSENTYSYYLEAKALGTAGGLSLMMDDLRDTFFVTNCDILIDEDYSEILKYHKKNENMLTVVGAIKTYAIPYGILEVGKSGELTGLQEKPNLDFYLNTGMYILEKRAVELIPDDQFFNITELMELLVARGYRVGVFPVTEKSWVDIGDWAAYRPHFEAL